MMVFDDDRCHSRSSRYFRQLSSCHKTKKKKSKSSDWKEFFFSDHIENLNDSFVDFRLSDVIGANDAIASDSSSSNVRLTEAR